MFVTHSPRRPRGVGHRARWGLALAIPVGLVCCQPESASDPVDEPVIVGVDVEAVAGIPDPTTPVASTESIPTTTITESGVVLIEAICITLAGPC